MRLKQASGRKKGQEREGGGVVKGWDRRDFGTRNSSFDGVMSISLLQHWVPGSL